VKTVITSDTFGAVLFSPATVCLLASRKVIGSIFMKFREMEDYASRSRLNFESDPELIPDISAVFIDNPIVSMPKVNPESRKAVTAQFGENLG